MTHTLNKDTLRELIAESLRDHWGGAPGDLADAVIDTLKIYAPKSYVNERLDVESDDKLVEIAKAMIQTAAFSTDEWEIRAAYPRLTEAEAHAVNDLIGMASVVVEL